MVLPNAVIETAHGLLDGLIHRIAEYFAEHTIPTRGREVGISTLCVGTETGVLETHIGEQPQCILVLVQCPVRSRIDLERDSVAVIRDGGREAIADLLVVGVLDGAIVDDVVPGVARNESGGLTVGVVVDIVIGPDDLVNLGIVPVTAIADDVAAHGGRGRDGRTGGQ